MAQPWEGEGSRRPLRTSHPDPSPSHALTSAGPSLSRKGRGANRYGVTVTVRSVVVVVP